MMASHKDSLERRKLRRDVYDAVCYGREDDLLRILSQVPTQKVKQVLNEPCQGGVPWVTAAERGYTGVVRLLAERFSASLDFHRLPSKNYRQKANALIGAARRCEWEMVQLLLDKGFDVNMRNASRQTALLYACEYDDMDMVKHLMEKGARIEGTDTQGRTCLQVACFNGSDEMVKYLLERGADPNEKGDRDETALHVSASNGSREIVELLLKHGATLTRNVDGLKPVIGAALSQECHVDVVETFVSCPSVSRQDKIDGLELLGAMKFREDMVLAYSYLERAMRERYQDPCNIIAKPHSPLPALTNLVESQSMEELKARERDHAILQLEFLAVLLRILGPQSEVVYESFRHVSVSLNGNGCFQESLAVFLFYLKAHTCHGTSFHCRLERVRITLEMLMRQGSNPMFTHIEDILGLLLEQLKKQGNEEFGSSSRTRVHVISFLNYILLALKFVSGADESARLVKLVSSLVQLKPSLPFGQSVLHQAAAPLWTWSIDWKGAVTDLPYDVLVPLLIKCKADINAVDQNWDRPLHIVARSPHKKVGFDVVCHTVRVLLKEGALVGVHNRAGQTPLDCAGTRAVAHILRQHFPPTLQTLAANAVLKYNLPYSAVLPGTVADIVRNHSSKKN